MCGIALTVLIGNMGLALMGTAIPLYASIVGWVGGFFGLILVRAAAIIYKNQP